jgi:hypothetical protein
LSQVVIEQANTRTISDSGGKLSGTRSFFVWDDTTPITLPSQILFSGSMPKNGDLFPGEVELFAMSFAISIEEKSNGIWKVVWTYGSGGGDGVPSIIPTAIGYIQVSFNFSGQFKDSWRSNPNAGSGLNVDIGGQSIDCSGEPVSVFVPQHVVTITETVTAASLVQRSVNLRAFVATRNATSFFGAPAGYLLYQGCSGQRMSLTSYSLTHNFLFDAWKHQVQQPKRNQQRQVEIDGANGFFYAYHVRWVTPFPTLSEFGKISENF